MRRIRLSFLRDGRMGMKRNRGEWRRKKTCINWHGLLKLILTNWQTPDIHIIWGGKRSHFRRSEKNFNTRRSPCISHITSYYNVYVAIDDVACTCSCPSITKSPDGPAGIFFLSFSLILTFMYGYLNKQTTKARSTTP